MASNDATGKHSHGLADILAAGIPYRTLDYWVRRGYLRPQTERVGARDQWTWTRAEQRVALDMYRLNRAGIRPDVAEVVARDLRGGPIVIGPGVVVSLFPADQQLGEAVA